MKTKILKSIIALTLCIIMTVSVASVSTLATELENNPTGNTVDEIAADALMDENHGTVTENNGEINHNYGTVSTHNGIMSYNYGTITENNGEILENKDGGTIVINESSATVVDNYGNVTTNNGEITYNYGTTVNNTGTVYENFGTVTENSGTVEYNLCGTVNGGEITHNYVYKIDVSTIENVYFYSEEDEDAYNSDDRIYVKENAEVIIEAREGFKFTDGGEPKITAGSGTITDNGDGTYTLSDMTGDISISAAVVFIPLTDISGVPSTIYAGTTVDLYDNLVAIPDGASCGNVYWELVDAGTTGAVLEDEYSGTVTTTAEGTIKVKTIVDEDGDQPEFTKEFTITVKDSIEPIYDAYTDLKTALAGNDVDKLKDAAEEFESILDIYNNLTDEYMIKLAEEFDMTDEKLYYAVLADWAHTNIVVTANERYQAYLKKPNTETKAAFINSYNSIFGELEYDNSKAKALVRKFIPDIDEVYNDAKKTNTDTSSNQNTNSNNQNTNNGNTKSPQTSDSINLTLWIALLFVSGAISATALTAKKRKIKH